MIKRPAWIFDVDGTLVDVEPVLHHILNKDRSSESFKKDFDAFHKESISCNPNKDVVDMVWEVCNDLDIIIVTARKEKYRALTSRWLKNNDVPHDALFMRQDDDHREDYEVKKDILKHIQEYWDIKHAVDDHPGIIKLWEENGISTTKIGDWDGVKG
jgi:phosphoglycolate phosphatase-like HAD superfamily hydrolase